jgi:hypothetical protein
LRNSSSKCRYFDESKTILDVISFRGLSVCAWIWKNDENDIDALLLQVYQMTKTTTIGDQL